MPKKKKKSFSGLNLLPAPQRGGQKESRKRACFLLTIIVKPCQCLPCKTMFSCSTESLKQAIANRNGSSVLVQCERLCLLLAASTAASSGLGGCSALPYALVPFSLSFCNYPLTFPVWLSPNALKKMSAQGGKNEEIWHRKWGWEMDFGPWEMNSQMGASQPTSWRVVLLLMEDMLCGMYSIKVTNGDHSLNIIYVEQAPCEEIMQQYLMMAMIQQVIERNSP